jgi:hypothetical protein
MRKLIVLALVVALAVVAVRAVGAEHNSGELQSPLEFGMGLKFGRDGFTLDSRVQGPGGGPWGLLLDGRWRAWGFTLGGRLLDGGKGYAFRLDGGLKEGAAR